MAFEDLSFRNSLPADIVVTNTVEIFKSSPEENWDTVFPGASELPTRFTYLIKTSVNMVRQKFVPLFTESGTERQMVVILPGRHPCQCLAVRHKLIGNCSSCGRIVCEQEGSGLCYFCGNLVCSPEEKKTLSENTRASDKLRNRLMGLPWAPGTPTPPYVASRPPRRRNRNKNGAQCQSQEAVDGLIWTAEHPNDDDDIDNDGDFIDDDVEDDKILPDADAQTRLEEGLVNALLQRDRLLHYNATTAKRTHVIDDELDYFVSEGTGAAAVWLDPETRKRVAKRVEELRSQREASRRQTSRICIDFANRTVTEENVGADATEEFYDAEEDVLTQQQEGDPSTGVTINLDGISDPLLNVPTPQFIAESFAKRNASDAANSKPGGTTSTAPSTATHLRVQNSHQQDILDRGYCLSMHQPWASMLVRGVKIHEGRTWYSAHRGPLWIAAAAKVPEEAEIKATEQEYLLRGARQADMPTNYPTGVLLGCVNVDDVLPQKQYRAAFPDGESNSPYVFICSNPRELLIKPTMTGQHKIYKLDQRIHAAAKESLT